jgi:hypothetical protein
LTRNDLFVNGNLLIYWEGQTKLRIFNHWDLCQFQDFIIPKHEIWPNILVFMKVSCFHVNI